MTPPAAESIDAFPEIHPVIDREKFQSINPPRAIDVDSPEAGNLPGDNPRGASLTVWPPEWGSRIDRFRAAPDRTAITINATASDASRVLLRNLRVGCSSARTFIERSYVGWTSGASSGTQRWEKIVLAGL